MLRVLGAVEIDGGGPIRSKAQRTVLSALALDAGSVVSTDRLCDLIWGDDVPHDPNASLQNHISRLRKVLPETSVIEAIGAGYRLDISETQLDTAAFEASLDRARASAPGDGHAAVDEALALWRGSPFTELDDERAQAEAVRFDELHLAAHELRAELLIAQGRAREAIGGLERQRRQTPLRERTVQLLMVAQLDAGRKSDALATFKQHRAAMIDELGLDPSPELRALELAILSEEIVASHPAEMSADNASTEAAANDATAPAMADTRHEHTAPPVHLPASTLFGRDDELASIGEAIRDHRLVTLVGPGGVGKTRLALHAAADAGDGFDAVVVVELAAVRSSDSIGDAVASIIGLPPRAGMSAVDQIIDTVADRCPLVVLDNCEHLVESVAAFADRLVRGAPGVHVLATSREPLNIDGERVVRVRPLPYDGAAVELFTDRAAAHASLALDDASRAQVEQICVALDGLPLAIELAAARCASMTLDELVDGLDERFTLFSGGRRTAPERHRSLRALVDWSVRSLDPELESLFTRTSVFSGRFTAADAAAVTGIDQRIVQVALAELIDRSLLVQHPSPGRVSRFSYLETIRVYGAELLAKLPDADVVIELHSTWALALVENMQAALATSDDVEMGDAVVASLADLRVAHARFAAAGDADRALRLCCALRFLALFRMQAEMFVWIRACADQFSGSTHPLAEDVLAAASVGSWQSGDLDSARRYAEAAQRVAAESSSPAAGLGTHEAMADVVQFAGDDVAAAEHFERAVALARAADDTLRVISNLADLAMVLSYAGEHERLAVVVEEAVRLATDCGSTVLASWVAYAEGESYAETEPDRATRALTTALGLADRSSAQFVKGVAGLTLTGLQLRTGDPSTAVPGLVDLIEHWRRGGAWVQLWITLRMVVDLFVRTGHHREAAIVLGAVRAGADPSHPSGPDALRLEAAGAAIDAARDDADELSALGASLGQAGVTDLALDHLRRAQARLTAT
jgi:predicted ATPase/DNA-binding SARP family transcriptional activator